MCCSNGWRSPCWPAVTCSSRACRGWPRPSRSSRWPARSGAVPADPVHPRPGAGRPRRDEGLPPAVRRVRGVAGAGVHQSAAGGRDQPRPGQGAERAAGGDAGAAGDHRAGDVPRAGAVPGDGDPEPDRVRRHLSAARGPGRPIHDEGRRRLSDLAGGARDRRAGSAAARSAAGDADPGRPDPDAARASTRSTSTRRSSTTPYGSSPPPARREGSASATWSGT